MEVNVNQIGGGGDKPHDCKKNNDVYNRLTNGMGESQTCKPSPSNNKIIMTVEIYLETSCLLRFFFSSKDVAISDIKRPSVAPSPAIDVSVHILY